MIYVNKNDSLYILKGDTTDILAEILLSILQLAAHCSTENGKTLTKNTEQIFRNLEKASGTVISEVREMLKDREDEI